MAGNELLIKINADAQNAKKAFDDVRDQTEELEGQLNKVAVISGIGFAALTAEVFLADTAFREAQKSAIQLNNALQNQGIYTTALVREYGEYADAVQAATDIDNDAVTSAQAVAQTYLGQTKITEQLTFAIADLAEYMGGDLNAAAEKIGKTIGTGTNAFAKQGLVIQDGATEAQRYAQVLEFVQTKAGGLAKDAAGVDGNVRRLTTAFGNFQEEIGKNFAPTLATARGALATFFETMTKYPILSDVATSLIAAGLAVTGLGVALAVGVPLFLKAAAAAEVFGITVGAAFFGIPLIIGATVAAATLLLLNFGKVYDGVSAYVTGLVTLVTEQFGALKKVIGGALDADPARIAQGLAQLVNSFGAAKQATIDHYTEMQALRNQDEEQQDKARAAAAAKEAAQKAAHQANLRAIQKQENILLQLQNQNASEEIIQLKQKEIETLKALDGEANANTRALLQERLQIIRDLEKQKQEEDIQRQKEFAQIQAETKAEIAQQGLEADAEIGAARLAQLQAQVQTEADVERQIQEEIIKKKIEANNRKLLDQKKYGESYAAINKVLHSDELEGTKSAADELVKLQQSKNENLRAIGKAAAVTQIGIATAESAMNIFRGFSTIPIIGPALGVAGAAAAIAYGGERISDVLSAANGGLVEGGVAGRDSVPALLMPGELVVPRKNFNDVVNAAAGNSTSSSNNSDVVNALEKINNKLDNVGTTNIFQGDVIAEDAFVDRLITKIQQAVENRNARLPATELFGV